MRHKLLLAILSLLALCVHASATAQGFDHPEGAQGADWSVPSSKPTGAAPADAIEPADVADTGFIESDWIVALSGVTDGSTGYLKSPAAEKKIRITCEPNVAKNVDFVLGAGQEHFGHLHQGSGLVAWDQNSTWMSARASPNSSCGTPLNSTLYIEPAMMQVFSNGLVASRRPQITNFYYNQGIQADPNDMTWPRRNTAMIMGANPSDSPTTGYNDQTRRDVYAAAGYEYPGTPDTPAGMLGWQCLRGDGTTMNVTREASKMTSAAGVIPTTTTYARHFVAEDGSDPWGGTCTGSVEAPGELIGHLQQPACWDRHNLRAPDGRAHFWYPARKPDNSVVDACPKTTDGDDYGFLPQLAVKTHWEHTGFSGTYGYGGMYLASDRMNTSSTPGDPTSKDPCRKISAYYCPGSTFHADWGHGWKSLIFDEALRECLGISVRGIAPTDGPAECNDGVISRYRKMRTGGASPNSSLSFCAIINSCSDASPGNVELYNPLAVGTEADITIRHDH